MRQQGVALLQLLLTLALASLVVAGTAWWFASARSSRQAMELVELVLAVKAASSATVIGAADGLISDAGGPYARLSEGWVSAQLGARWTASPGQLRRPVPGMGLTVQGARSPWDPTRITLDVGYVRMWNLPSEVCPTVALGLARGVDRVLVAGRVVFDQANSAASNQTGQSALHEWCSASPLVLIEVYFA